MTGNAAEIELETEDILLRQDLDDGIVELTLNRPGRL